MVIFKDNKVGKFNFWNEEGFKDSWNEHVGFWFEESPDREDEMIEMLEEGIVHLNNLDWQRNMIKTYSNWVTNVETLLESLKQEK